jgi:hypothetical protein
MAVFSRSAEMVFVGSSASTQKEVGHFCRQIVEPPQPKEKYLSYPAFFFAFLRRVSRLLARIFCRSSGVNRANPFGTFAAPPFRPIFAKYSLTGERFFAMPPE